MSSVQTAAARLRRPSWRDPRLIAGALLVVLSVVGVVMLVQSMDRTRGYWAASSTLVPGEAVHAEDFRVVRVHLGDVSEAYLPADRPAPQEGYLSHTVQKGELVPANSIVPRDPQGRQPVALTVPDRLPEGVSAGDRVDVWVSAPEDGQDLGEPTLTAAAAEIVEIRQAEGAFGTTGETVLQVMLLPQDLPKVLAAKADGSRITVVPAAGL